jgi:uncharacterized protein with von Willebrand factor type A (vWA) domain
MPVEHAARSYDVDLAALATAMGQRLHNADMQVTPHQSEQFARALQLALPGSRTELYHTARAIFVTSFEQIETFDGVFEELFGAVAAASEAAIANAEAIPA